MCPHRVVAHDDVMYGNYELTRALVIDHQQQMHESARQHRLAVLARRAQRGLARTAPDQGRSTVHYLPTRELRMNDGVTRAAS